MPKYRVEVEAESLEELRRILMPEERREVRPYGYYILQAKSAVTSACRQIVRGNTDAAKSIIAGVMQSLAQARQAAVFAAEEEEISQAVKLLKELLSKLKDPDQAKALEHCCEWLGRTECP
jgi:hypothetical protein